MIPESSGSLPAYCWIRPAASRRHLTSALFMTRGDPLAVVADWWETWVREFRDDATLRGFRGETGPLLEKKGWAVLDPRHWEGALYERVDLLLTDGRLLSERGRWVGTIQPDRSIDLTPLRDGPPPTRETEYARLVMGYDWY